MLNKKIALLSAAAFAMVSTGANAATENATATVDILAPVTLAQTAGLDFGVVGGAVGGTATIGTGGDTATCSTGLLCAGTARRGAFSVTGSSGYNVAITVDTSTSLTGPGTQMALNLTPSVASVTGNGTTAVTFHVGGVLTINAGQTAGTYTGNYNVSADYQ